MIDLKSMMREVLELRTCKRNHLGTGRKGGGKEPAGPTPVCGC